jgi:hypothetical protein
MRARTKTTAWCAGLVVALGAALAISAPEGDELDAESAPATAAPASAADASCIAPREPPVTVEDLEVPAGASDSP